jgi:lipoprotein NlpI
MRVATTTIVLCLVCPVLRAADEATDGWLRDAAVAADRGDFSTALDLLDRAVKREPDGADAYYQRGRVYFCLGKPKQAVADFDQFVKLRPQLESRQWERGISLYYAGEFDRGAKQFEMYQTYHDNDVENSVWRYLCVARSKSVAEAQKTMLPIENDRRVPMMQVFDLYRGKLKPEDVLTAANKNGLGDAERNAALFYAHLYLGLWHEAAGKVDLAAKHVAEAEKHKIGHYMYDVARVHRELRSQAEKPAK